MSCCCASDGRDVAEQLMADRVVASEDFDGGSEGN